jgi:hypothetical protein
MEATKEKHATNTPGPWHAYQSRKDVHRNIVSHYGAMIAREVHHANARLIAAAPDLLAQCKEFEKCLTHLINSGDSGADLERDKLREVLAKVEGGEG